MSIVYVLTIILIIGLHMLIYKKEEKENFLKFLILTNALMLCYNIVICVILSFIKIKCTLSTLSIVNIMTIVALGLKIFKDKKIQKYYINKMDILATITIIIITAIICMKQYGLSLNIKCSTTDAATHYLAANEFYNYSILLLEENSDKLGVWNEDFLMPGAYINTGIIFKIFSVLIDEIYFCKLYILFDISMWLLSGLLMYILLSNNKIEEKQKILPLIFSIIYMFGYPLHTLISGFSYLQVGLNIILTILLIVQIEDKTYYKYILMFIANVGLMFSYYYFAPVVFWAIFIQILLDIKSNNEKIFSVTNLLKILISLIIPGLFGVMYFMVFQYIKYRTNMFQTYGNALNIQGPIYNNLITTILIFVLLDIYYIIKCIKNKKQNVVNKLFLLSMFMLIIAFIGMKYQKVSEYYFFKLYYMIWIFVIVEAFNAIEILKEKRKILTHIGICLYCIGIIITIMSNKNILFFDIYQVNFDEIKQDYKIISDKELEIFEYYDKNIDTSDNLDDTTYLYVGGNNIRPRWAYALTKNTYIYINTTWTDPFINIQQFFDSDKKYCVIFKFENEEIYENIEKIQNIKILFKNEAGVIIEKY